MSGIVAFAFLVVIPGGNLLVAGLACHFHGASGYGSAAFPLAALPLTGF